MKIGGVLGVVLFFYGVYLIHSLSTYTLILLFSFVSLLFHEVEEYVWPGKFPRTINSILFKSKIPDRYPLNSQISFVVNVVFGWSIYLLAIFLGPEYVWLAVVSVMVSVGNIFIHVILLNVCGKRLYNPGMATSVLLFLPISVYFFYYTLSRGIVAWGELGVSVVVGLIVAYSATLGTIQLMKDKNTKYYF